MKWRPAIIKPSDGTWCWLYNINDPDRGIWIGTADSMVRGGWTNEDTWEDFRGEVTHFWIIELPTSIPKDDKT